MNNTYTGKKTNISRASTNSYFDGEDGNIDNLNGCITAPSCGQGVTASGNDRGRLFREQRSSSRYGNGNACNLSRSRPGRYLVKLFACESCSCQRKVSPDSIRPSQSFRLLRTVYSKHRRNYVQTGQVSQRAATPGPFACRQIIVTIDDFSRPDNVTDV